jgi:hypothetical protein
LALSVWVFTHSGLPASAPHKTSSPAGHVAEHFPLTQTWASGQTALHEPQLSVSFCVFTQTGPHAVWPAVHVGVLSLAPVAQLAIAAVAIKHTTSAIARRRVMRPLER